MLNFHQLFLFKTVVEKGGFTSAANALYISQPAVSLQVRRLEKRVGMPLMEFYGNELHLTQAGRELFVYARQIFQLADQAEEKLNQLQGLEGARLRVGASTTPGTYLLPRLAADFQDVHKKVVLELSLGNSHQIGENLLANDVDVGLLGEETNGMGELELTPWLTDYLVVVSSPGHPLAGGGRVDRMALRGEKFVVRERGSNTRKVWEKRLQENDIPLQISLELPATEAVKQGVMAGWGIACLSYLAVQLEVKSGQLVVIPLAPELEVSRHFYLARHRSKRSTPIEEVFTKFCLPWGISNAPTPPG